MSRRPAEPGTPPSGSPAKEMLKHNANGGCHDWMNKLRADDAARGVQRPITSMFRRG